MNVPLLHRLMAERGGFVEVASLGMDGAAVARDLDALETFGFPLERHPFRGVALTGPCPRLCPDQIEWELGARRVGRRIAVWDRVPSTNDVAASAAGSRLNDGLVVLAESQTSGRGRRGRSWVAPPGSSLLLSTLLHADGPTSSTPWLMALGAVACAEVASEWSSREARIKWPNDVVVEGRKIAGVLVERGAAAVVGIGLNVNWEAHDLPGDLPRSATSIRLLTGSVADRSELARALILSLDRLYVEGVENGPSALAARWRELLDPPGRSATIETRTEVFEGRIVDADLLRGLAIERDARPSEWVPHESIVAIDGEGGA